MRSTPLLLVLAAVSFPTPAEAQRWYGLDEGQPTCVRVEGSSVREHRARYYPTERGSYPRILGCAVEVGATRGLVMSNPNDQMFLFFSFGGAWAQWPPPPQHLCCYMVCQHFAMIMPWDPMRQAYVAEILIDEAILPSGFSVMFQVYGVQGTRSAFPETPIYPNCRVWGLLSSALIFNHGQFEYR